MISAAVGHTMKRDKDTMMFYHLEKVWSYLYLISYHNITHSMWKLALSCAVYSLEISEVQPTAEMDGVYDIPRACRRAVAQPGEFGFPSSCKILGSAKVMTCLNNISDTAESIYDVPSFILRKLYTQTQGKSWIIRDRIIYSTKVTLEFSFLVLLHVYSFQLRGGAGRQTLQEHNEVKFVCSSPFRRLFLPNVEESWNPCITLWQAWVKQT